MDPTERRFRHRGRARVLWDALFTALRFVARHASSFYAALGLVLVAGAAIAVGATWMFVELADVVSEGATQAFDEAVLRWMAAHQKPWLQHVMFEITLLGTGLVLMVMVAVSATFLWLSDHRFSALLLVIATWGGVAINSLLKSTFDRPRPQVFEWGADVLTSSFPSGHAMTATITYGTVAYLAARLQRRRLARWITLIVAGLMIVLICFSRLYLGVHYPTDVVAGALMGLGWTAFCMAMLEGIQVFGRRFRPEILEHEEPAPSVEPEPTPLHSPST
jgi:undecaprenyl-diphosphatase